MGAGKSKIPLQPLGLHQSPEPPETVIIVITATIKIIIGT